MVHGQIYSSLSDAVFTIASDDLWIESLAINNYTPRQIYPTCSALWGCQITSRTRLPDWRSVLLCWSFLPALVGNDIGCGMALWQTDILLANTTPISLKSDYQIWMTLLRKLAGGKPAVSICTASVAQPLGSIGGGNHFAELQQVDQISTLNCLHWQVWMRSICNCWL